MRFVFKPSVLDLYYHITKYHKLCCSNKTSFISSRFCNSAAWQTKQASLIRDSQSQNHGVKLDGL